MANDEDDQPPKLKLVSENPNARLDRQAQWAKQLARQKLSEFAASLLRTMAGSASEAAFLPDRLKFLLSALDELTRVSGQGLSVQDAEDVLCLHSTELDADSEDHEYRYWLREHGMEVIVQGALRLAAHRLLNERPHFGGKYSEDVIERGVKLLDEAKAPIRRSRFVFPDPVTQPRGASANRADVTETPKSPKKKTSGSQKGEEFSEADLKDLRKAIKARDDKRIKELKSKLGKRSPKN